MVVKIGAVFLSISLLQTLYFSNCNGVYIPQEKCDYYQKMFSPTNLKKEFPYSAVVFSEDKLVEGILISENFVLTIANNVTVKPFVIRVDSKQKKFHVVDDISNRKIRLLKLNESVSLSQNIRPACLPQPQHKVSYELTEMCWVDNCNYFINMNLNIVASESCIANNFYGKRVSFEDADGKTTNICVNVPNGDKDMCYKSGLTVLADHQQIVGIASKFAYGSTQNFVRLSEYVSWIERFVWPNENQSTTTERSENGSTTTEKSTTWTSTTQSTTTEKSTTRPIENGSTTTEKTPSSDELLILAQISDELHEIHKFLNVNLVLIVLILLFVLCISCILWSDGRCIRAALPDKSSSSSEV